jgi:hypothetical protein
LDEAADFPPENVEVTARKLQTLPPGSFGDDQAARKCGLLPKRLKQLDVPLSSTAAELDARVPLFKHAGDREGSCESYARLSRLEMGARLVHSLVFVGAGTLLSPLDFIEVMFIEVMDEFDPPLWQRFLGYMVELGMQ